MTNVVLEGAAAKGVNFDVPAPVQNFLETLPEKALSLGVRILLSVLVFVIGVQMIKLIRRILKKSLQRAKADVGVVQFLDSFVKMALYVVLIFTIATGFGVDAASIVALVGSAGVAIGLALQGSLSNFAGGVLILLLKPFKVGDYIKEDNKGNEGTVVEIQLFYTKLATADNRIIILPNGTLANTSMTNVTEAATRRLDITVGISYDSDIRKAKAVLTEMLKADEATLKDQDMRVYVDTLAESSINLGIRCFVKKEDYWETKWRLTEETKYTLDKAGITIPFPQLDVHCDK
ncbi:MAG: mechanosensitive ion channel [Lachnospiraceae bacterium]|nr:mechanosensitive ion channel [Lachnospiraceae bacterium]